VYGKEDWKENNLQKEIEDYMIHTYREYKVNMSTSYEVGYYILQIDYNVGYGGAWNPHIQDNTPPVTHKWIGLSKHKDLNSAIARTNFLNGGTGKMYA